MTDRDLATLIREHVRADEPPFLLSADTARALGRRALVRRRARRGLAGVLIAAAAVAALPLMPWGGSGGGGDRAGIDPATRTALANYDPAAMPKVLSDTVGPVVRRWAPDLQGGDFIARDDQGQSIPKRYWDKASQMDITYGLGEHTFRTILLHSRSEAEGDARKNCAEDVASGYMFSCEVSTGPNGDLVTTTVTAARKLDFVAEDGSEAWGTVTREELRTGKVLPGDPSQRPIDPSEIYFQRSVESVHSRTFLTSTVEQVRAPDLAHARTAWQIPVPAMVSLVTDPSLVIPKPPLGSGGCPWMWHATGSCPKDTD
jgi:hypothetical protein